MAAFPKLAFTLVMFPDDVRYPLTLTPVPVAIIISALPATLVTTFPPLLIILTLLEPLIIELPAEILRLDNPPPSPVNIPVLAVNADAVTVPVTFKLVKVPTLVIFGCALVVSVPVKKLADTKLLPVIFPVTVRFPNVPIVVKLAADIKFGCVFAADVNVPVRLAKPPPTAAKLFENTFAGFISITRV